MKLVIKLSRRNIASILICILFSSSLMKAQQPITSIINVANSQVSYPYSRSTFDINYNAPAKENVRVLQFSVPGFNSSVTTKPVRTFVKIRRSANPLWMMQEKNLLKREFC